MAEFLWALLWVLVGSWVATILLALLSAVFVSAYLWVNEPDEDEYERGP